MDGALLSLNSSLWRTVISTFVENSVIVTCREDSMKHLFCEKSSSGCIVGKNYRKGIVVSHLSCSGRGCPCLALANNFLFDGDNESPIDANYLDAACERLVNGDTPYPLVAILFHEQQAVALSYLCHEEACCQVLNDGTYILRNGLLSRCSDYDEGVEEILMNAIETMDEMEQMSSLLTEFFCRQSTQQWPRPEGLGVTLWHYGDKMKDIQQGTKMRPPKGKVSAFNFYARLERHNVLEQNYGTMLKNNEINAILGRQWNTMSEEERFPYKAMADADVERHQQEMLDFNAEQEANNLGRGDTKAMTAYNRFMHEETKFVHGMNLKDAQVKMGKHAGLRWKSIDKGEEYMYNALNAVEEAKLKKMF